MVHTRTNDPNTLTIQYDFQIKCICTSVCVNYKYALVKLIEFTKFQESNRNQNYHLRCHWDSHIYIVRLQLFLLINCLKQFIMVFVFIYIYRSSCKQYINKFKFCLLKFNCAE